MTDFTALRSAVSGPVLTPADEGFAAESTGFNLFYAHSPEVVVGATSAADVVAAVNFARDNRMPVRVIATGHGSHALVTDGVLVNTSRLDELALDTGSRIATIGAGVRWGAVVAAGAEAGLAPITGSSTNVGVVGYILGGGLGPLARSHGFSSDYLRGATVVLASGEVAHASETENPDLFWALRGGKGGFGVVTSVEVELVPLPALYAGALVFPEESIETVLRGWIDWTATAEDDVTTSVAIIHFPPVEQVPEVFRGKTLAMLRFAYPGSTERGEQLAAPLRDLGAPMIDGLAPMPIANVAQIHNDPTEPGPGYSRGALLNALDQEFATALLQSVGSGVQTPVMVAELRHLGGATSHDVPEGSSAGGRASGYTLSLIGAPNPALFEAVLPGATDALLGTLADWVSHETNVNFAGSPSAADFPKAWPAETFARLAAVRAAVDPQGVFAYGPKEA
ncbi:MAG: FAD-binding protein [Rhodoglobus sp.]|nr:FAD-binding protein [Rhodoglobus sp.]